MNLAFGFRPSLARSDQVVYDTFTDELRAGYAARITAREAWYLD